MKLDSKNLIYFYGDKIGLAQSQWFPKKVLLMSRIWPFNLCWCSISRSLYYKTFYGSNCCRIV